MSLKIADSSKIFLVYGKLFDSPKIPALATFCKFQTIIYSVFESKHFTDTRNKAQSWHNQINAFPRAPRHATLWAWLTGWKGGGTRNRVW